MAGQVGSCEASAAETAAPARGLMHGVLSLLLQRAVAAAALPEAGSDRARQARVGGGGGGGGWPGLGRPPCSLVTPRTRGRRGRGCWGPSAPRAPPRAPPRACSRSSQWRRPQRGRQTAPPSPCPARPWAVRAPRPPPGGRAPCEWPWMLGGVSQAIRERCLRRRVRGEEAWPCAAAGQTSAREAAARHAASCAPASALDWTCLPLPHGVITNWCYKQRLHGKAKPLNRQARRHFLQAGPMRDCRAACAFKTVVADGCTCRVVLRGLIDTGLNQNWRWRGEMPRQLEWRQRRREARSPLAGRVAARRRRQSLRFALF